MNAQAENLFHGHGFPDGSGAAGAVRTTGKASVWFGTEKGETVRLPLTEGGDAESRGLVLTSSCGSGGGGGDQDSLRAACWLMPSLSPELIAQALEWSVDAPSVG
ncbi:hypothetical protein GCM10010417_50150 [Streptomyces carpaticus]